MCQKSFAQEETPFRTMLAPEDELKDPKQFAILKGQVGLNRKDFWALIIITLCLPPGDYGFAVLRPGARSLRYVIYWYILLH